MSYATQSPEPDAAAAIRGVVNLGAQVFAGLKTFQDGIIAASQLGAGASDICNKIGTSIADGSVNGGAKLLSLRTGLGGSEFEYASFSKPSALNSPALALDAHSITNAPNLVLANSGAGVTGLAFDGFTGASNYVTVGNGFFDLNFTNHCFRFNQNNDAFSPGALGLYDFNSAAAKAYPLFRGAAASGHTGKLLSLIVGAAEKFSVDSFGNLANGSGDFVLTSASGYVSSGVGAFSSAYTGSAAFYAAAGGGFQSSGSVRLTTELAGSTVNAIAGSINALHTLTDAGAKLWQWLSAGVEKALVDKDGMGRFGAGLGIGNSAAATTPGSVVKKMQVFDMAGASLGYVPIYGSIT